MDRQILISIKTVIFTFLLVIGLYIIYRLGPVIAILMKSGINDNGTLTRPTVSLIDIFPQSGS